MGFPLLNTIAKRSLGFLNRRNAENLWKSATGVRPGGMKKGRLRKMKLPKDLNRGQILGEGQINIKWPGLTASVYDPQARTLERRQYDEPSKERLERLEKVQQEKRKTIKKIWTLPLYDRGWTGVRLPGRVVPNPDPIGDEDWRDFKTICIFLLPVTTMGPLGRIRRFHCHLLMGNGNGLISWAAAKMKTVTDSVNAARRDLPKKLTYVHRLNDHTIYHSFMGEMMGVRVLAHAAAWGTGLKCHRVLAVFCKLVGIRDIHIKVDGNATNYWNVVHAFLCGLVSQETHEELADRMRMHIVEFRPEYGYLPTIVASPSSRAGMVKDERMLDYEEFYTEGRQPYPKTTFGRIWYLDPEKSWSYRRKLYLEHPKRNHRDVQMRLLGDFKLNDWTIEDRQLYAVQEHEKVVRGEKPVPIGIGLTTIDRDTLEFKKPSKKRR